MADRFVQAPQLNNIRTVPEDVYLASKYHLYNPDKYWHSEAIQEWQTSRGYKQPIQMNDKQYFELHRSDANDCYFEIYDVNGIKVQDRVDATFVIYDANTVYRKPDGTDAPLTVHKWQFKFSDLEDNDSNPLEEGVYTLRFVAEFYVDEVLAETRYQISEPLDVKDDHPDTVYLEYHNDSNKNDVIFNYDLAAPDASYKGTVFFSPHYGLRVHGTIAAPDYDGKDFELTEQDYEERLTDGFAWRNEQLIIGGDYGVPAYMIDKLNNIIRCDYFSADSYGRMVKESGAKVEQQANTLEYPLFKAHVKIRHYNNQDIITDNRGVIFDYIDLSGGYPKAILKAPILPFTDNIISGVVIKNDTDRDDLIDYLNGTIADIYGFQGEFSVNADNVIRYENAPSENFYCLQGEPSGEVEVLDKYCTIDLTTTASNQKIAFYLVNGGVVLDVGEQIDTAGVIFQKPKISTSSVQGNVIHEYDSADDYTALLFFRDSTEQLNFTDVSTATHKFTCRINNVTGDLPAYLKVWYLRGADFASISGGFDMDLLARCRQNIQQITFRDCGIDELNGNVFVNYPSYGLTGSSANWAQIAYLSIQDNQLDATDAADFISNYYDWAGHVLPSVIWLKQNPVDTIVDAGALADIASLTYAGHYVVY